MRKPLSTLIFGAASLLLAGCQSSSPSAKVSPEFEGLRARSQQMSAECETRKFKAPTVYTKCLNDADAIVLPALINPELSNAWQLRMARRMVIAEQVERKQITSAADLTVKLREVDAQAASDISRIMKN